MARFLILTLALLLSSACGSPAGSDNARRPADARGSSGGAGGASDERGGGGGGAAGINEPSCETFEAAASAEEAAQTPRERPDLEQLAIAMDGSVVADPVRYGRLLEDSAAIWRQAPDLPPVGYSPSTGYDDLSLIVDEETHGEMLSGSYRAWDCLNERYGVGVEVVEPNGPNSLFRFAVLSFTGAFNLEMVAADYTALPGIEQAWPSAWIGANDFCAADLGNDVLRYFVLYGAGDCMSGCTQLLAFGFESSAPGVVTQLGSWDSESGEPAPEWLAPPDYCW